MDWSRFENNGLDKLNVLFITYLSDKFRDLYENCTETGVKKHRARMNQNRKD
jgi:hypothetical protein